MATDEQKAKRVADQTAYRARKKAGLVRFEGLFCTKEEKRFFTVFTHAIIHDEDYREAFRKFEIDYFGNKL